MDQTFKSRAVSLQKGLQKLRLGVTKERGAREQLQSVRQQEVKAVEALRDEQQVAQQAQIFLLSEISERRKLAIDSIQEMGTTALRLVYGQGYSLRFETYEERRKSEGVNNFKMEIKIVSPHEGKELVTGLVGERGGGVVEFVASWLRIAALSWKGYEGPIIFDEVFRSMSNDGKLEEVARLLRDYSDQTGRQVIFVTHQAETFAPYAHHVLRVDKCKATGLAGVEVVDIVTDDDFEEEEISDF